MMQYSARVHGSMPDAKILVNGYPVHTCHFADEENGVARCYQLNDEGNKFYASPGVVAEIHYHGVVEIKCSPEDRYRVERYNAAMAYA